MSESEYRFVELTVENAVDAVGLEEKIGTELSVSDTAWFIDRIEAVNSLTEKAPGLQNGFVVYDATKPVAYLGIQPTEKTKLDAQEGEILIQRLGGFVTDPEKRNLKLLNRMMDHVIETQNPDFIYAYLADAMWDTSYKGLQNPGVRRWLQRNGYSVLCEEKPQLEKREPDLREKSSQVFLYPALWDELAIVSFP